MPSPPSYDAELLRVLQAVSKSSVESKGRTLVDDTTEELESVAPSEEDASAPVREVTTPVTARTLFSHPEAHPVIVDLALLQKYGAEWLEWEPETVQFRLMQDFGAVSDLNFSKAMAMKTLHLVDSFWERWEVFNWCLHPINALFPDFDIMQVPTAAQTMVAVDVANRVREDVAWSEEVRLFIGTVHRHDGILVAQPPVDTVAIIDTSDINIDLEKVRADWPNVRVSKKPPTADTAEAEQLRRMLTVFDFLAGSRIRLRSQLHLVQT